MLIITSPKCIVTVLTFLSLQICLVVFIHLLAIPHLCRQLRTHYNFRGNTGEDLTSQLKGLVPSFQLFSLALDESTDIDDTAQLLIFVQGISENIDITKELLSME